MTLQDEETPIDREIVNEVVALTPETWNRAVLEVEYSCDEQLEEFEHVIYRVLRGIVWVKTEYFSSKGPSFPGEYGFFSLDDSVTLVRCKNLEV